MSLHQNQKYAQAVRRCGSYVRNGARELLCDAARSIVCRARRLEPEVGPAK